ncbi:condensation domain-containing protein [Nocardia sp. NPDC051990]|uniref:condensation domain-containing protein n=1 Tax=Nocardia sp. NPDC051990 TaxID=3155285 RepID=UPI003448451E
MIDELTGSADNSPQDELERSIAEIWSQLLGEAPGNHDGFFDSGGDSLLAIRLLSRVEARTGRAVELPEFLRRPTVSGLAAALRAAANTDVPAIEARGLASARVSFGQYRLWFMQQLEPDSTTYNVLWAARIIGALDLPRLQAALDIVVSRHEALRTCFVDRAGVPEQIATADCRVRIEVDDVAPEDISEHIDRFAAQQFDLTRAPLLRLAIARLAATHHLLVVNMHHAVTDGRSMEIFARELSLCYNAFAVGSTPNLPDLPVRYGDYAEWQRDQMAAGRWNDHIAFWRTELADWPLVLDLPADRPHPEIRRSHGATMPFVIPNAAGIRATARRLGGTAHMILMTAFQAALARISGRERFVVGTAVAGRPVVAVENVIGFFVNTIPVKADCSGTPSLPELFDRVRHQLLRAYEHQDLPLDQIVDAVRPPRDPARTPLFQTVLTYVPDAIAHLRLGSAEATTHVVLPRVSRVDLLIEVIDTTGTFDAVLEYNTDLFDRSTVEKYLATFLEELDAWTR